MEDIENFDKSIWLHFLDLQAVTDKYERLFFL